MSLWKSRWSRPRLRNAATSKTTPATRPITRAWLETSIAQALTPCSTITANSACRSGASGVVSAVFTSRPAIRVPTVPITAACTPAASSAPSSRRVVVVLPWVPVTAIRVSEWAGSPYSLAARVPSTLRGFSRTRSGTPASPTIRAPSSSVRIATAPASTASAAYVAPWARLPGSAA